MSRDNLTGFSSPVPAGVVWRSRAVQLTPHTSLPGSSCHLFLAFTLSQVPYPCPCAPWKATLLPMVFPASNRLIPSTVTQALTRFWIRTCTSKSLPDISSGCSQGHRTRSTCKALLSLSAFPPTFLPPSQLSEPRHRATWESFLYFIPTTQPSREILLTLPPKCCYVTSTMSAFYGGGQAPAHQWAHRPLDIFCQVTAMGRKEEASKPKSPSLCQSFHQAHLRWRCGSVEHRWTESQMGQSGIWTKH